MPVRFEGHLRLPEGTFGAVTDVGMLLDRAIAALEAKQRPTMRGPIRSIDRGPQNLQQSFRLARYLHFPHDPARVIHNADTRLLD